MAVFCNLCKIMHQLKLVEVRSEIAAGTRGASLGVDAVKLASLQFKSDYFGVIDSVSVEDENDALFKGNEFPRAKHIDSVLVMVERVRDAVAGVMGEGKFPLILAGDHSTAAGTILGIKKARPNERLGVIWIDAHADLHSPYTSPSGNMHGMPLAMVTCTDNLENKAQGITPKTEEYWNKIKALSGDEPAVDPKDIVFVGVRDTESQEDALIAKYGLRNFTPDDFNLKGLQMVADEVLASLDHCDNIYVSFDVDVLDATIAKGTGTPVAGGLSIDQARLLNQELIKNQKVCAWEMVEVNPTLDHQNLMAEIAFEILENTTDHLLEYY